MTSIRPRTTLRVMARELLDSSRFTLNRSEIAMQIIDGEAVVIDVITGNYHGMGGVACGVVNLMALGIDLGAIRGLLESRYPEAADRIASDLQTFVNQLLDQRIMLQDPLASVSLPVPEVFDHLTYTAPVLETYEDMAELMALDPPMPTVLDSPWNGVTESGRGTDSSGPAADAR